MKMKTIVLLVPVVMGATAVAVIMESTPVTTAGWQPTTTGPGFSLNGKMFTLSVYGGGISLYPPYYHPHGSSPPSSYPTRGYTTSTRRPYTTTRHPYTTTTRRPYTTTTRRPYSTTTRRPYSTTTRRPYYTTTRRPYYTTTRRPYTTKTPKTTRRPHTTTAPPTQGVSVCLRYLTDFQESSQPSLFTLSPSSSPLQLRAMQSGSYQLTLLHSYSSLVLTPSIRLFPDREQDPWTSVCLTVDSRKQVVQVFSGSNMSIRKLLQPQYLWSGEPVMDVSGFGGQVTDVQVWDYPLRYKDVYSFMSRDYYRPYRGSALTWSYISYSLRGNTLLEDTYEWPAKHLIRKGGRGRGLKGEKVPGSFSLQRRLEDRWFNINI